MNTTQLNGFVRSRRRGNQKLLFIDINLQSLLEQKEEDNIVVNDRLDVYYKYKTSFTPKDGDTFTLIFFSEDTFIHITENDQKLTLDQLRKLLTVGSQITCEVYEDSPSFYDNVDSYPPWFKKGYDDSKRLFLVTKLLSIHTSKPTVNSTLPSHCNVLSSDDLENTKLSNVDDIHCNDKAHKKQRTSIFVTWLLDIYGKEYLNSGSGVIDIAGGKGAISWELQCIHGIKCTLLDPRTVNLSGKQKKYLRKMNREKFNHHQIALHTPESDKNAIDALDINDLFKNSSLLIGMHPDEATDAILEYACYYQKPLAIVPCCVYAEVFTHRKIADKPVLTYENLLNYLQFYPHNPLQRISLPFSGRNIVLYNSPNEKN